MEVMTQSRCWAFAYQTKEGERRICKFDGFNYESVKEHFLETFPDVEIIHEQEVPNPAHEPIDWENVLWFLDYIPEKNDD